MSKDSLYKRPQYAARHPEDDPVKDAILGGAAAAGMLAHDDNTNPLIKDAANRALHAEVIGPAVKLNIIHADDYKRTWREILRGWWKK